MHCVPNKTSSLRLPRATDHFVNDKSVDVKHIMWVAISASDFDLAVCIEFHISMTWKLNPAPCQVQYAPCCATGKVQWSWSVQIILICQFLNFILDVLNHMLASFLSVFLCMLNIFLTTDLIDWNHWAILTAIFQYISSFTWSASGPTKISFFLDYRSGILQAGCHSFHRTNSVKAMKAFLLYYI